MVSLIVYSKDRAMQMDLLLSSIKKYCGDLFSEIIVLYTTSYQALEVGYEKFGRTWPEVRLVREVSFQSDVMSIIGNMKNNLVCVLSDDCIFYRDIADKLNEIMEAMNNPAVYSFILGLGRECVYSGTLKVFFRQPHFEPDRNTIRWVWKHAHPGEFACPFMLAGNIYRRSEYLYHLSQLSFTGPSFMEMYLQGNWQHRRRAEMPDYCACFAQQTLVHSHNNRVQNISLNPAGIEFSYPAKILNDFYLAGQVIDLDALEFVGINGLHKEINLVFKPES